MLLYLEGVLYCGVKPADVDEIFTSHLEGGVPVSRLIAAETAW